jgi:hypothetical protein
MDVIGKMVKTLPQKQYEILLEKVGGNKNHKNYVTLECLREGVDLERINALLGISKGAFTTHKSRLLKKISTHISTLDANPVSLLKEETARISHIVLQNEREVALRILFDMEERLKKYDLANELSIVYKLLSRLHRFYPEYEHYEMQYKKYVAYALSATKAEDLLYGFIFNLSHYYLNQQEQYKESIRHQLLELESFSRLYTSHRLYVIYNTAKIYYDCCFLNKEELALQEIEVEGILNDFKEIFDTYSEDGFYQNIRNIVPFLFFEYYAKIDNVVKANYYLEKINNAIPFVSHKQLWPFFITQMINSIVSKLHSSRSLPLINSIHKKLLNHYHPNEAEVPHFISYFRFNAILFFYDGKYSSAAKTLNTLRNTVSLKNYVEIEAELKLLQALQYAILDDEDLAKRYLSSTKRAVIEHKELKPIVKQFGKVITLLLKHKKSGKETESIKTYWSRFSELNNGKILFFVQLSDIPF